MFKQQNPSTCTYLTIVISVFHAIVINLNIFNKKGKNDQSRSSFIQRCVGCAVSCDKQWRVTMETSSK